MKNEGIQIELFCEFHKVDLQLVKSIIDFGTIEIIHVNEQVLIPVSSVEILERCIRLANDLGVNLEGLDVINHMRTQIIELRRELEELKKSKKELLDSIKLDSGDAESFEIIILE